jgi:hypothetical protein
MDPNDVQQVRKIIEQSASKVSLRDLEKKGFRKVKVLRANDIDELIRRAVHTVIAREGGGVAEKEEIIKKSREELKEIMAQAQAAEAERAELAAARETLDQQVRMLQAKAKGRDDLEARMKELQRRLADAEEAKLAAESESRRFAAQASAVDPTIVARAEAAERRAGDLEATLGMLRDESGKLRDENAKVRERLGRVETETKLKDEIEMPKLRERIEELQGEVRGLKAELKRSEAQAPGGGLTEDKLRLFFKEIIHEVRSSQQAPAPQGAPVDHGLKEELGRMSRVLADGLARAGVGRTAASSGTEAELEAAKIGLEKLFAHEAEAAVQSNVADVSIKESQTEGVKDHLKKLKAMRKGGPGSS